MSLLSHQSYANLSTPLWLSATSPAAATSPFRVVDNVGNPTKQLGITVGSGGTADLTLANFTTGNTPIRIRFSQPPAQGVISFNTGNLFDSFAIGQTSTTCATEFRVAVNGSATQNLILSNTATGGTLQSGTSTMTLSNNGTLDFGGYFRMGSIGYTYTTGTQVNGNTSFMQYFRAGTSPNAIVGGMGIQGVDGTLYFGTSNFTNLSNITAYQFAIDKFGIVGTYGSAFQVHDPVTFSNYINFSNSAGQGYLDLVANSGLLYNQIQFGSNATSLPRETIVFGANSTAGVSAYVGNSGNLFGLSDPTQVVVNYLDTTSHQWVFQTQARTGSPIPAMIINTNGIVSFPQGISVNLFTNPVSLNASLNGVTRYGQNSVNPAIYVNNQTITITLYNPYYYVSNAFGLSALLVIDWRTQTGSGSGFNTGVIPFEIWNTQPGFDLPCQLVVNNAGNFFPFTIPSGCIAKGLLDMQNFFYCLTIVSTNGGIQGNNYMIG